MNNNLVVALLVMHTAFASAIQPLQACLSRFGSSYDFVPNQPTGYSIDTVLDANHAFRLTQAATGW